VSAQDASIDRRGPQSRARGKRARGALEARVYEVLGFGDRTASAVRHVDIDRLRDALTAGGDGRKRYSASTATSTMALISKMYTWARRQGYIDCANPVSGCERPPAVRSLDYLSKLEVAKLLDAAEKHASVLCTPYEAWVRAPMCAVAIYAGLRKGECFGLRWIDVHLDAARIDVNRSYDTLPKSGKPRHVPMHPELVRILRDWKDACPKTKDGLVFPVVDEAGEQRMGHDWEMLGLADLLTLAGCHVPKKPFHALRHTFASHFMMGDGKVGGNILTLQKLLGHAGLDMTLIYAHLAPSFMATEVARMSFPRGSAVDDLGEERRKRQADGEAATA
jgi:integrase